MLFDGYGRVTDMAKEKREIVKFTTPVFRVSFPHLFEAHSMSDDPKAKAKFGLSAIWTPAKFTEKEKVNWRKIREAMNAESIRAFKKAWKDLEADTYKKGLRNGSSKEGLEGYGEGTMFANLTTKNRPGVIAVDGETKIGPEHGNAEEIYPGCYARATVTVYSFSNKGKGIALGLRNVQKIKDGPRIDNRTDAEDDFDEDVDSEWLNKDDDDAEDFD